MCEFCLKHGEGKRWYLEARNYAEDLLSDLTRRDAIVNFFGNPESLGEETRHLENLDEAPEFVRRAIARRFTATMKKVHFGQVVPVEDVERIFDFVTSVVRVACVCRHITVGTEHRFCYGLSMGPNGGKLAEIIRGIDAAYLNGPNTAGLEAIEKAQALANMRELEQRGAVHTVWTFVAPFIGGICNCDRSDCLAMRATVTHGAAIMFRAEYVAWVNPDLCAGCRACMCVCQFGAIEYSTAQKRVKIDTRRCYGCGICRAVCVQDAITLRERTGIPAVAKLW